MARARSTAVGKRLRQALKEGNVAAEQQIRQVLQRRFPTEDFERVLASRTAAALAGLDQALEEATRNKLEELKRFLDERAR